MAEETVKKGISGAALKWIAVISMFIDHTTAVYFETVLWKVQRMTMQSYRIYYIFRCIGRPAFPIYCFLLVEGYLHTRDVRNYLLRLFAFGVLSDPAFDLAFYQTPFTLAHQNVYFTLALGLAAVWFFDLIAQKDFRGCTWWRKLLAPLPAVALAWLAEQANTDYGWTGVAVIVLMYWTRSHDLLRFLGSGPVLLTAGKIEAFSFPDYLLFHFYNGQRGRQPKYFFYLFYPGHLALLALARRLLTGT